MSLDLQTLPQQLRALREASGRTQREVAALARLSRPRLAGLESGAQPNVELATLQRLLDVYGMALHLQPRSPRKSLNQRLREDVEPAP